MIWAACLGTLAPQVLRAQVDGEVAKGEVDFRRDIRPILSDHCFKCHGPDGNQRKADLRLDDHEGALSVITVESPAESELIARIDSTDDELRMPPPDAKLALTVKQRELLRRWVRQGAKWETHWAFDPIQVRDPHDHLVPDRAPRSPIDVFVQRRLLDSPLDPASIASQSVLVRRLYLDLTGLPPSPDDVQRFLENDRPSAYERLVEQLLASPDFGERMAWDWLDAARYADSNGYQGDGERTMWPWRDWVVSAVNRDLPFDEFTRYQLAGDLLPDATEEQKLATGFCRNHMINGEGGRIPEENRVDYVMDMTETMGTVWLGLTLNCCRCHDHKFDPLTQRDYYELAAFFNQTPVNGGGGNGQTPPVLAAPSRDQREQEASILANIKSRRAELSDREKEAIGTQAKWETRKLADLKQRPLWERLTIENATADQQVLKVLDDHSVLATGDLPAKDNYQIIAEPATGKRFGVRLDALRHESHTENSLSRSGSGNFVLTKFAVELVRGDAVTSVPITGAAATFEQGSLKVAGTLDDNPDTGWAVWDGKIVDREHAAVFTFKEPIEIVEGDRIRFTLRFQSTHEKHLLGRFRLSLTQAKKPSLSDANADLLAILTAPAEQRNDEQRKAVRTALLAEDAAHQKLTQQVNQSTDGLTALRRSVPKVMVMEDMPKRRETFMLNRGLYNDVTDVKVDAAVPAFLTQLTADGPATRRDLAEWIVSADNPLTARVVVNRYWQQLFGIGLVETVEDFGVQGEVPEHRELLDWLAADFRRGGWDVKQLMRTIVTSHTYRQSSRLTPEHIEHDPKNRLMSRGARYRLPSWMIRDQTLAASGLLVTRKGGPPVKGYQPAGVWEDATFGKKKYQRDSGEALYRRSLYTFWRRIIGPTMFFDNAARQTCTVKMVRTNTPLHALMTFNDVTYVEASRVMAEDILRNPALQKDQQRLGNAYLRILARFPSNEEITVWMKALERARRQFAQEDGSTEELLSIGESPRNAEIGRNAKINSADHAAWTALLLAIFNLDETFTRQ